MKNPLLEVASVLSLPAFTKIKADQVESAIKHVFAENQEVIDELIESNVTDASIVLNQLQQANNKLGKVWSPVSHLNAVMNNEELRSAYTACLPLLSDYQTELGQNKKLLKLIEKIKISAEDKVQRKVIENLLKSFKLSGVGLPDDKKLTYKKLSSDLSKLSSAYSDNVLDETKAWTKSLKEDQLSGLSESAIEMLESLALQHNKTGWLISLDFPIFNAVMTFANDRELRKEVYTAFTTRASDQSESKRHNNSEIMAKIIRLRTERSNLIGFDSYAEQSLYKKMAESPDQVIIFLNDLLTQAKPQAEEEMKHLKTFAKNNLGINSLQSWDLAFVSEKLQNKELDYSEEDLKPWFSVNSVLDGLFELVERLYEVSVQEVKQRNFDKDLIDLWHEDVKYYEIVNTHGECIAGFYLDLFARKNKRGGAWMDSYCGRYRQGEQLQTPVAYMTCNSSPATVNKPALFTHNEVITLFHEFGHGLHHMLTTVDYLDVSGINGVEWDAVELPSQFMENWCWQRESLDLFAVHYETGALIPNELFIKMQKSRHYNSAMAMMRQLEFSIFDMQLHMDNSINSYNQISSILEDVRKNTSLLPTPEFNRSQNTFSHIFAGGYAAGYFSYKWAEVLSSDVFDKFEENGIFNKQIAAQFLHEILERGGSRSAKESFIAFRGREPDVSALLRHSGIQIRE